MAKTALKALIIITALALFCAGGFYLLTSTDFAKGITEKIFGNDEATDYTISSSITVNISNREDYGVSAELEKRIEAYFERYYSTLAGNEQSLSPLYSHEREDLLTDRLAMRYEADKLILNGINPTTIDVNVSFTSSVFADNIAEIELKSSISMPLGEIASEMGTITHKFTYKDINGEWEILSHSCDSDVYSYTENELARQIEAAGYTRSDLTYTYLEKYTDLAEKALHDEILSFSDSGISKDIPEVEFAYHRDSAYSYTRQWISGNARNITYFGSYDNNAANFTSQCLVAGGIAMDTQGDSTTQWKWYNDALNNNRERSGYSESFIEPEAFYNYCKDNTGFGLVSLTGVPLSDLETGDIIQLLDKENNAFSQCIVTAVTDNIYVSMNTTDRQDYPLYALPFANLRTIKIIGYNTINLT